MTKPMTLEALRIPIEGAVVLTERTVAYPCRAFVYGKLSPYQEERTVCYFYQESGAWGSTCLFRKEGQCTNIQATNLADKRA